MAKKAESHIGKRASEEKSHRGSESHASGIVDSIEKNRVIVISSAIAGIVIFGLFLVGRQLGVQRHIKAGQMYTAAAASRNIEGLDKVVAEFAGSISAGNALLSKADIQIDQGKTQDAISTLNQMAGGFAEHPRHAQAYFMLANIYHKSGDLAKAKENYEKVLDFQADGEFSPITRIRLGDLELAEGHPDKARQNYEESYTLHPGNPFVQTAEIRLAQLKVGTPPEVDRPLPPETEKKTVEEPEKKTVGETPKPTSEKVEIKGEEVKAEVEVVE